VLCSKQTNQFRSVKRADRGSNREILRNYERRQALGVYRDLIEGSGTPLSAFFLDVFLFHRTAHEDNFNFSSGG